MQRGCAHGTPPLLDAHEAKAFAECRREFAVHSFNVINIVIHPVIKGQPMHIPKFLGLFVVLASVTLCAGTASATGALQSYFNFVAIEVKATPDPAQKRKILDKGFQSVSGALTAVENLPVTPQTDRAGIERYKSVIQDKRDELNGKNGYTRVADGQLNAYSTYVVQNMEQAELVVTIGLVTLLLILLIILLIL